MTYVCVHATAYVWISEDNVAKSVFSVHICVSSGYWTEVPRLLEQAPFYPLSQLAASLGKIF